MAPLYPPYATDPEPKVNPRLRHEVPVEEWRKYLTDAVLAHTEWREKHRHAVIFAQPTSNHPSVPTPEAYFWDGQSAEDVRLMQTWLVYSGRAKWAVWPREEA